MGLFSVGKKKKKDDAKDVDVLKFEQVIFENLTTDEDKFICGLADKMMQGQPLILNFEDLDIDQANKIMAFFSGVVYAIEGEIVIVKEKVFMFATKDVYEDGSMEEFLKEIVE